MRNLISTWVYIETKVYEKTLKKAIQDLNLATGLRFTHSRISEMTKLAKGRGSYLSRDVRLYMMGIVFRHKQQFTDADIEDIC